MHKNFGKLPILLVIMSLLLTLVGFAPQQTLAAPSMDKGGGQATAATPLDVTIPGAPISVIVRPTSSYGVYRNSIQQFYGGHAEGVYLWVNGAVWGPEQVPAGLSVNEYTPVSNTLSGDGSAANPWVVTTVLNAGGTGLTLTQKVTYVNGQDFIRNDFQVCAGGADASTNLHLFHAADLYTQGSDAGYGYYDPATGSIGGYNSTRDLFQIFTPITRATHFEEDGYFEIWDAIGSTSGPGAGFQDTYRPNEFIDNGAGLEWAFDVAPACATISDYLSFTNQAPQSTVALPAHVLVSLMADGDTAVAPGDSFTFTVMVQNTGPGVARATGVRIPLNAGIEVTDFHGAFSSNYVDYVGDDAVSVLFHDLNPNTTSIVQIIAQVRSATALDSVITSRAMAYWDDNQPQRSSAHRTMWSNSVTFTTGPAADSGKHGLEQTLLSVPTDPVAAGTPILFGGAFYGQEERISLWVNVPDKTVLHTEDYGVADKDGIFTFGLDTTGLVPGVYTIVAHGRNTQVEGVGTFTIK
jgi:hypothetical protein